MAYGRLFASCRFFETLQTALIIGELTLVTTSEIFVRAEAGKMSQMQPCRKKTVSLRVALARVRSDRLPSNLPFQHPVLHPSQVCAPWKVIISKMLHLKHRPVFSSSTTERCDLNNGADSTQLHIVRLIRDERGSYNFVFLTLTPLIRVHLSKRRQGFVFCLQE